MTARLTIDLAALVSNFNQLKAIAPVGAVVKADAYGLGAQYVVSALLAAGCRDFFVATLEEALALRVDASVYVFSGVDRRSLQAFIDSGVRPVLNSAEQVELWRSAKGGAAAIHVDTGMQRLGFEVDTFLNADLSTLDVSLLLTHYACADEPEHPLNRQQQRRFAELRAKLPGVPVSLANSAGVLNGADWVGDLGRPGIALYGGNPFADAKNPMAPVVSLEGRILQIRSVGAGVPIGYGASYMPDTQARIAVVGVGYADGVPRLLSNRGRVAIGSAFAPIVGRVSMDTVQVDVSCCEAAVGDWVEVIGPRVTVDEVARHADTIGYEVLTGLGHRPERRYLSA